MRRRSLARASLSPSIMISDYFRLLRDSPKILGFGFLVAFFSSFGQTFYISLSVPYLTKTFGYTNTEWGSRYSGATLLSALCLPILGAKMDQTPLPKFARLVALGLTSSCLVIAIATNHYLLALALFGLRLTGQGLLSIMATATMARLFHAQRGKALSIATMGFPLGETLFPPLAVFLMSVAGWRTTWILAAGICLAILLPLGHFLLKNTPTEAPAEEQSNHSPDSHWSRRQVLRHWQFYTLLPTYVAPGFLATGLVLYQFSLADEKGWSHMLMASSFVAFGLSRLVFAFLVGPAIDRFGANRLFAIQLLPLGLAMMLMSSQTHPIIPFVYNGLIGISLGIGSSTSAALWAELYGTKHLGAIKSLTSTIGIFCTSLSPILVGRMLDLGITFPIQMQVFTACLVVFAVLSKIGCASMRHLSPKKSTQAVR